MANDLLHDDIVCNILARLPAKPLLRFRCVSTHWNCMLREPSFMKLRSRKTILLPLNQSFQLIDDNDNTPANSVVSCRRARTQLRIVIGTFNGIVVLLYRFHLLLYNPFTRVCKKLPPSPTRCYNFGRFGYGFGYGYGDERDLKVVRIRQYSNICDVYNFKEGSWSSINYKVSFTIGDEQEVGTCISGVLYWIVYRRNALIALDVKDMAFSEINLPFETQLKCLGTTNEGCLCALYRGTLWVMKERNRWSKMYSLKVRVPGMYTYGPLCILSSGRILIVIYPSLNVAIYDPIKNSYASLNISLEGECVWKMHVLEYVESMVSPLDIMSSA